METKTMPRLQLAPLPSLDSQVRISFVRCKVNKYLSSVSSERSNKIRLMSGRLGSCRDVFGLWRHGVIIVGPGRQSRMSPMASLVSKGRNIWSRVYADRIEIQEGLDEREIVVAKLGLPWILQVSTPLISRTFSKYVSPSCSSLLFCVDLYWLDFVLNG